MAPYLDPLIRSGAMWSCGGQALGKPRPGLWARIRSWFSGPRQTKPVSIVFRSELFTPEKPQY